MRKLKEFLGLTYYVSPLDQFLNNFDRNHPKLSSSQLAEQQKALRIAELRDNPIAAKPQENFWDKF